MSDDNGHETRFDGLDPLGPGTIVPFGDIAAEIVRRGEDFVVRVRDPKSPALHSFVGVPTFPVDEAWVIPAKYRAFEQPHLISVGASVEGLEHVCTAPGEVMFNFNGTEHSLTVFSGKQGRPVVLFTDATSGVSTYKASRKLIIGQGSESTIGSSAAHLELDFNRALNLPCAFIDFATCPLPPVGNHLRFHVTAGERTPHRNR